MSALASLNADYSDSEDELEDGISKRDRKPDEEEEEEGPKLDDEPVDELEILHPALDRLRAPSRDGSSSRGVTPASSVPGSARLVSYGEEGAEDDEEASSERDRSREEEEGGDKKQDDQAGADHSQGAPPEDDPSGVVPMDLESESSQDGADQANNPEPGQEADAEAPEEAEEADSDSEKPLNKSGVQVEAWTGGVQLPPEPVGHCKERVQRFFTEHWQKKQANPDYNINVAIHKSKKFRNPSIYAKLIEFCGIDEHGTNFPKELYDGHLFGKESYYDELDRVQAAEMKRREKAAEKRKAESEASAASAGGKRKSKWDQGGPASSAAAAAAASKTISAFGPLKK